MNENTYIRSIFLILLFFAIIATAAILKLTQSVVVPVTMAILLSFVFYPFVKHMQRIHIPWGLGIIIIVLITLFLFFVIGNLVAQSLSAIISAYPRYENRFTSLYKLFASTFKISFDEESSLIANMWNSLNVRNAVQTAALGATNFFVSGAKVISLIVLLIIFLLLELRTLRTKVDMAFPSEEMNHKIIFIAKKTITQVTRYVSIKFMISLLTGTLVFLATFAIKMDFAIVWGFLAFLLNFIPNFGSIISWLITSGFAILQFYPRWGHIIYVAVLVLAINMLLGSIIEPRWEGSDLGISPFVILVSLSLWGWMWGFIGMILSVPMMVIIKIICENSEILKPIAVLLGNGGGKKRRPLHRKHQKSKSPESKNGESTEQTPQSSTRA